MTYAKPLPNSGRFTIHTFLLATLLLFTCAGTSIAGPINTQTAKQLIENKKVDFILDVRTPQEFKDGHLEGATLIPLNQLQSRLGEIAQFKNKSVLVYCAVGGRSGKASRFLKSSGFSNILDMKGGIIDWAKRGYPVKK
ncbi:hypothetical protein MNBD_NITROSPINAE01-1425 [hydrothermal vent metagenome]|uniref:Rhodanese domain-containing protein n=1 Tax=hydrothermal vent metagenome TaxID=652676 RepID=A0A3B1C5Q3_9ZZZZ